MPLTLAKIAEGVAETSFDYLGETVHLTYRPSEARLTMAAEIGSHLQARATKAAEEAEARGEDADGVQRAARRVVAECACRYILAWDVAEDEGGAPIPLDPERLQDVDPGFLGFCLRAVYEDCQTGKATGTLSSRHSQPTSSRRTATGTSSKRRG